MKVSLHAVALFSYLPAIAVMYLAASYLGGMFRTLFALVALLPLLSQLLAAVPVLLLQVEQRLDNDSPIRGDAALFSAQLRNRAPFPIPSLRAKLVQYRPDMLDAHDTPHGTPYGPAHDTPPPDDERLFSLGIGRTLRHEERIDCAHRGTYRVGLAQIRVTDMLGWATYYREQQPCRFTVYPRITGTRATVAAAGAVASVEHVDTNSRDADPTLLRGLVEYHRNDPMRNIAWRKFAAHGIPYVKEYDSGRRPAAVVCIDLRRIDAPIERRLAADDCSVESLVAVVKSLVDLHIPVDVYGFGECAYEARLTSQAHFRDFYLSTRMIRFCGERSPQRLLQLHGVWHTDRPVSAILITHRFDQAVLTLLRSMQAVTVAGLINTIALSEGERRAAQQLASQVAAVGGTVSLVNGHGELVEAGRR